MTVSAGENQTKDQNKFLIMRHLGVMRVHLFDTCPTHANQTIAERAWYKFHVNRSALEQQL